jgi:UPF0716 family protein affecting phage T7 exclusion
MEWQQTMEKAVRQQVSPADALWKGLASTLAGILLIIPGFITDGLACLCLFPTTRHWLARRFLSAANFRAPTRPESASYKVDSPASEDNFFLDGLDSRIFTTIIISTRRGRVLICFRPCYACL